MLKFTSRALLLTIPALMLTALPVGLVGTADAQASSGAKPSLPHRAHGQDAIQLLGDQLNEVAALNGMSAAQLRQLLRQDHTAWLDTRGRLFYIDSPAPAGALRPGGASVAPYPLDQTFLLHSKPGSQKTILLDFDGANVSGTQWNTDGLPAGNYPGWSLDEDPTTFNQTEREEIQSIWQRVAEDYAPFDVDVTTEDPGLAGIERADAGDAVYGTRALISQSNTAETANCGGVGQCGGIAYVNVFGEIGSNSQPAWIFAQELGENPKNIAEAAAHEVGHNFGLQHDGRTNPVEEYYSGHAMWAPIMGAGYDHPVTQWSKGEYANASNTQDDVAIIAAKTPYRADEAGATVGTASSALTGTKYITTAADQDVYALGTCNGALTVSAAAPTPATPAPDLDIKLDLLNSAGTVVATDNPVSAQVDEDHATGLSASVSTTVAAGTYFVRVDGVGNGNATTGYTDYGSLGAYAFTLTGSCGTGGGTAPGAPTVTSTTPSTGAVSVAFTGGSNGGSPITGYSTQCTSANGGATATKTGASSPLNVTTVTPGKSYHCRVNATNAIGTSPWSAFGAYVVVPSGATAPAAPTVTDTTPSTGQLAVSFNPGSNGGSPVTSYLAQCTSSNGGVTITNTGGANPLTVNGATAGKSYHCRINATNAIGTSPWSTFGPYVVVPPSATTPAPPTVTNTTSSSGQVTVAFTAGATGGSPITSFTTQCTSANNGVTATKTGAASPLNVTTVTPGKSYHCRVNATNAIGTSAWSAFGDYVVVPLALHAAARP